VTALAWPGGEGLARNAVRRHVLPGGSAMGICRPADTGRTSRWPAAVRRGRVTFGGSLRRYRREPPGRDLGADRAASVPGV